MDRLGTCGTRSSLSMSLGLPRGSVHICRLAVAPQVLAAHLLLSDSEVSQGFLASVAKDRVDRAESSGQRAAPV